LYSSLVSALLANTLSLSASRAQEGLRTGEDTKRKGYLMALYEHIFLARQDISPQQVEALTETYSKVITENGGTISKSEYWGLKSLTYRVKKNRKAHFTLLNIDAPSAAVQEMERQMGISDDTIRHLTLRVDELEEGPSVMMRSRGNRDKDDRRPRENESPDQSAKSAPITPHTDDASNLAKATPAPSSELASKPTKEADTTDESGVNS
jgi:small subunit ribosomal protein S6